MAKFQEFKGRTRELKLLDELWATQDATLLILYGRRRVGKTRLLRHWSQQEGIRALYWVAEPSSALDQLRSFSQAVYRFANPNRPAPPEFSYATWEQAWEQVAHLAQQERLALLVDEFTHVLEVEPSLAGRLQNLWDSTLSQSNLFLVLCGSHPGMMNRHLLSYHAPLYGRAIRQLHLQPFSFGNTRDFFPGYAAGERVAIYAIFGGIPAYWELVDPAASVSDNIRHLLLTPGNLLQAEPRLLLQDFVREPHNYASILQAIATGFRSQKEISRHSGLTQGHVSMYLSNLQEAGFVERRTPVTAGDRSRLGRYHISDPYLRFYYRFVAARQAQLAMGEADLALVEIEQHLLDFIGLHTWAELCREWTLRAGVRQAIPLAAGQVGSVWTRRAQVEVVGIHSMTRSLILGECQWQPRPVERPALVELVGKTAEVVPAEGQWQVYYLGFGREGWTAGAQDYAREVAAAGPGGANWQAAGMRLLDLAQLDADLQEWVGTDGW
ncbi:MAG: ATP-binding protein [Chloroflexi bacterium]|nr:ATP-binding protein [Chloroflexota bacterium]MCI0649099.1 ATP-binding protein [Chloroflexota bacterium]MCI0726999.1 ATP-binding protein [Chloroflexota bacterium]